MKQLWNKLGTAGKRAASVTAIIAMSTTISGLTYATYSHFQTDLEAETARMEIIEKHAADKVSDRVARNNDRIDRLERENARYEKDNLDPKLPQVERDFNNRQIEKNDEKIRCIREFKC